MTKRRVRPLALAVIRRRDRILVFEGVDRVKGTTFYRPLGGAIEFGELGADAVLRELREEIGADVDEATFLDVLENVFVYEDEPMHEIVLLYEVALPEGQFTGDRFEGRTGRGEPIHCVWMPLAAFALDAAPPLHPEGLLELLNGLDTLS